jgi:hypothetical protein
MGASYTNGFNLKLSNVLIDDSTFVVPSWDDHYITIPLFMVVANPDLLK